MADLKELPAVNNKDIDKHNTGIPNGGAPAETRLPGVGPVGPTTPGPIQSAPRPPLNRADSRSNINFQSPRPGAPPPQQRPQFQSGGPAINSQQFAPRPGTPAPRGPVLTAPPGSQQIRPQPPPLRPAGPQIIPQQQSPRPLQSPTSTQPPLRAPPPNNLQFGPRQPPQFGGTTTPDGNRPPLPQQSNGAFVAVRPQGPGTIVGQLSRQPSQGSIKGPDTSNSNQSKTANLDNQSISNFNIDKPENGIESPGAAKGRSYSIAAAPGAPSPLKMEDDRRKSVSSIGGRSDELSSRSPGLGLIQEVKTDSKDNLLSSKDSIQAESTNDVDRPASRLAGSKMTESFIGSLPTATPKKKLDDDDDVVLQNTTGSKSLSERDVSQKLQKTDLYDRSPSLTRSSDESPEPKQKSQNITSEPQRPKTPKQENKTEPNRDVTMTPNKTSTKSPISDSKPPMPVHKKPNELNMSPTPSDSKKSTPRKVSSAPKTRPKDGDNDSGVDESTQGNDLNGSPGSPNKKLPSKLPTKEKSSSSLKPNLSRSSSKSATPKTPENPPIEKKKVPMNKIQVGNAPSPNIKTVKSKIGSLDNTTYRPGGGKIKIENRKLDFNNVTPKIAAKNDAYIPSGGSKKIITTKLEWNAKSKIGSLQNTAYKPGGGDKKIETVKLDFKDKAKPKVASTVNITHKPGGGAVKSTVAKDGSRAIENQKLEFKAQSKVGSLDNVKHKPGGGEVKIFDDKEYIKQTSGQSPMPGSHSQSRQEEHYYMSLQEWSEEDNEERSLSRSRSARAPRTPRTPRALSPRKQTPFEEDEKRIQRNNERNRRASTARPMSAREPPRSSCSRTRTPLSQRPAFTIY